MPGIAVKGATVMSIDGQGYKCASPMETSVGQVCTKVKVDGEFVVTLDMVPTAHNMKDCVPDDSKLTSCSGKVRAQGKGVGRIGDMYTSTKTTNTISSGSSKVMAGG